jgi:hypothetical protein
MPVADQPNHELSMVAVSGTQKTDDSLWNNSKITYWGVSDLVDGKSSQWGYYNMVPADCGRDWWTFEGRVTTAGGAVVVEGTYKLSGGDGEYLDATGSGRFVKSVSVKRSAVEPRVGPTARHHHKAARGTEWPGDRRVRQI